MKGWPGAGSVEAWRVALMWASVESGWDAEAGGDVKRRNAVMRVIVRDWMCLVMFIV